VAGRSRDGAGSLAEPVAFAPRQAVRPGPCLKIPGGMSVGFQTGGNAGDGALKKIRNKYAWSLIGLETGKAEVAPSWPLGWTPALCWVVEGAWSLKNGPGGGPPAVASAPQSVGGAPSPAAVGMLRIIHPIPSHHHSPSTIRVSPSRMQIQPTSIGEINNNKMGGSRSCKQQAAEAAVVAATT